MIEPAAAKISRISHLTQIIVFNLIPLYGVLILKWDARLLILTYFWETIIAVLFHAVRLWYVHLRWGSLPETKERSKLLAKESGSTPMNPFFVPLFMLVLFGFFCFVQMMIMGGFAEKSFPDGIFTSMYRSARGELAWVLVSFTFIQLVRFFKEVITGKYAGVPVEQLFFQPFKRIFVQQLTVILGGFFILFGGTQPYLIILVLINLAADLFFFFIENAKLKAMMTHGDPEAEKKFDDMKRMMKY